VGGTVTLDFLQQFNRPGSPAFERRCVGRFWWRVRNATVARVDSRLQCVDASASGCAQHDAHGSDGGIWGGPAGAGPRLRHVGEHRQGARRLQDRSPSRTRSRFICRHLLRVSYAMPPDESKKWLLRASLDGPLKAGPSWKEGPWSLEDPRD